MGEYLEHSEAGIKRILLGLFLVSFYIIIPILPTLANTYSVFSTDFEKYTEDGSFRTVGGDYETIDSCDDRSSEYDEETCFDEWKSGILFVQGLIIAHRSLGIIGVLLIYSGCHSFSKSLKLQDKDDSPENQQTEMSIAPYSNGRELYEFIISNGHDIGTYAHYKMTMKTPEGPGLLFEHCKTLGLDVGTIDEFLTCLTFDENDEELT